MDVKCPKCGSAKVVPVGQYDKFIYFGFGGTAVITLAGFLIPLFWFFIPVWWLVCLSFYIRRPLAACEECNHGWDPRKPI